MTADTSTATDPAAGRGLRRRLSAFREGYPHFFLLGLLAGVTLLLAVVPYGIIAAPWQDAAGEAPRLVRLFRMDIQTWFTLTVSGMAMGLLIFIMSSGMTLTFGLMNVLNLAHGGFISFGAFCGATVVAALSGWGGSGSLVLTAGLLLLAFVYAMVVTGALGVFFERVVIRPVYGNHLKQILVTIGGSIILVQLIQVIWGSTDIPVSRPELLRGAVIINEGVPLIGGAAIEIYRLMAVVVGLILYGVMQLIINRTKIGVLIRAGVENTEMVEIHGYRIRMLFLAVFVAGSALAGLGGAMWGMYEQIVNAHMGEHLMIMVIVVIILGGLGSVTGCFYGAILVGLINLYVGYLEPRLAGVATVGLMVAVLMWRPQGLIPVLRH
ncbi:branched-chain amino acid ABC transporter permease [Aquisalimonas lutea]|uniref:branched-chain amino acid ABC transporter permease n=1 Tax=Aquisalimonas lutea TaxID=1327750 RepID=UPI0025B2FF12|nr:branched-chain amino acid ABC transporter permease [Aquisalimonas lutea]MDN3517088.1 branched-chain amino acid ABC transporter permease [Aquisalimonas lutea]